MIGHYITSYQYEQMFPLHPIKLYFQLARRRWFLELVASSIEVRILVQAALTILVSMKSDEFIVNLEVD